VGGTVAAAIQALLARGHAHARARARGDSLPVRMGFAVVLPVQFLRSTLLPAAIVLLFGLALFAVSARIWLPGDMAAPAPMG